MADLSLLIVNYRSAALTAEAVRSARATTSLALQIVVVDNSEDEAEAAALRSLDVDEMIRSPRNLGYGAAINLGRASCSASMFAFSNPDVVFGAGCLELLAKAVRDGAALAGPLFSWDDGGEWLLPLPEVPSLGSKALEILAARSQSIGRWRERRGIRRRIREWSLTEPTGVSALSGALICMRTELFDRLGGFDERFFLYFEEIDLARRARTHGPIIYVPEAVCRHLYAQTEGEASNVRYLESERRFFDKWHGAAGRALLRMGRARRQWSDIAVSERWAVDVPETQDGVVVEASPSPAFPSAAGHFPKAVQVIVPAEIEESYRGEALYARVARRDGTVLRTVALSKNG